MQNTRKFIVASIIGLVIGAMALPVLAQDEVNDALKYAISFLSQKLGKPIQAVDTYTYEAATFADASLDCPEEGKVYSPGVSNGYKFLMKLGGITYDVRVTADKTQGVLCTNTEIKQPNTLAVYRSPLFTIAYPSAWRVTDRTSEVFFGLGVVPICAQPGMVVTSLGSANDKTPDTFLNEYRQSSAPGAQLLGDRANVGTTGRSMAFTAACADGSTRQSRVTVFVAFGKGYRVWQYAPQTAFAQWSDVFNKALEQFSPSSGSANITEGKPVILPSHTPTAALTHVFGGNVYSGTLADLPGTPITFDATNDHVYRSPVVSGNGTLLAYVDPAGGLLYVAPARGGKPRKIAQNLAPNYPPAWKADSSEIAYVTPDGAPTGSSDSVTYAIMAIKPDGSGARKIGTTAPLAANCKTSTSDPASQLYWLATGPNGNEYLMVWGRSGTIYYTLGCGIGTAQIGADDGKGDVLHEQFRRFKLSPDGTQLLGLVGPAEAPKLARLTLADRKLIELNTANPPDQVAWSADGKIIYYSSAVLKKSLKLDDPAQKDRGLKAFGFWPFQTDVYTVALNSLDLASDKTAPLYSVDARAIVNLAPAPTGGGLLFVVVQSGEDLVEAFRNSVAVGDLRREAPTPLVYWLPQPTGQIQLVAVTLDLSWGPLGSAPAPTPTGAPGTPGKGTTPPPSSP